MHFFTARGDSLLVDTGEERLVLEPWGTDAIRVRGALAARGGPRAVPDVWPQALLERDAAGLPGTTDIQVDADDRRAALTVGRLRLVAQRSDVHTTAIGESVHLAFEDARTGRPLLAEDDPHPAWPRARRWREGMTATGLPRLEVSFRAAANERLFGLGQYQHGRLDQKPGVHELEQQNMRVSVPFLLSSRGYGLLWNNPAIGRVELTDDWTRWVAEATPVLDYWVTAGDTPAELLRAYADATGHPSPMPDWGLGYWQSTLRYETTAEVLAVVREHVVERGLPMSVLVIDALHWPLHGDWAFKPADWPGVEEMTAELARLGVRVLVSTWPLVNPASVNHAALEAIDGFARGPDGRPAGTVFVESDTDEWVRLSLIDNTRPAVRDLVFDRMRRGYLDRGVAGIWLDGCEPETILMEPESITYAAGPGLAVQNQFPREQARLVAEGQWAMGRDDVITLARSA
ncbi:MAG TPA: TIM-barrel domain-containing protein, partial [Candidatus Limnocylindrales bacterium]|nr:TIM-barrel domain-containing protein [Candidatus Limnocylindrales bacterium]